MVAGVICSLICPSQTAAVAQLHVQGADIGPVGASTMVKLCSNQRDLDLALELYYRMVSIRTTFNRWVGERG